MADQSKTDEARKAMSEYEANAAATRAKTERLKALRLAKEAQEAAAAPVKAPAAKKKSAKTGKAVKKDPGKLSDWIKDQQNSGRRT
jgi:hypothetical protein